MAQAAAASGSLAHSTRRATVGGIAGSADSTGVRIASDLSRLPDGNDLRVIPVMGKGSVQDIGDLPIEANGIAPQVQYLEHGDAIERLKRGGIDALAYVGGKASRAFGGVSHKDRVHFPGVEYLPALQVNYLSAIIRTEDYPNLVAPDESAGTVGVSFVVAINGRPRQPERLKAMARFVEKFLERFGTLNGAGFSAKWAGVNLRAPVKGWQRFEPARMWLAANAGPQAGAAPQQIVARTKTMLQKFVEDRKSASGDQEEFFNSFVLWYREHGAQAPQQW